MRVIGNYDYAALDNFKPNFDVLPFGSLGSCRDFFFVVVKFMLGNDHHIYLAPVGVLYPHRAWKFLGCYFALSRLLNKVCAQILMEMLHAVFHG